MRLDGTGLEQGQSRVVGTQSRAGEGDMRAGFLEDRTGRFFRRIFVGGGTVNILSHLGSSGVSLWESFFLFLIYNYNIYEYKCM